MPSGSGGTQRLTAAGAVGVSGKPIYVYGIDIDSSGGGNAVSSLKDGTSSGSIYFTGTGVASTVAGISNFPANGIYFPNGCYVTFDANTQAVILEIEQMTTF